MDAHKDKAIRKKYSAALMSNHKWREFFLVMSEHGAELCGIEYHFTDTENVLYGSAPLASQVWESAIDDPVQGAGGPIEYKHIEFIKIPYVFECRAYEKGPVLSKEQQVSKFLKALEGVGSFPVTQTDESVVIYGYKT